jgi:ABC-2 type transport system ATP-binding protein/nitrous oxidase accessory protein
MLNATAITKRYGTVAALDGLSFETGPGEITAIIGSNGAGKTTLLKSILGLIHFQGSVEVDGIDVARKGKEARRLIGYLPQNPALHQDLTVRETVLFYAELKRVSPERAREAVDEVRLGEHSEKRVSALSGGMQQRLALAIALLARPRYLVLDEPTSSLDIAARLELRAMLKAQRDAGACVLLSTHWLEDVPFVADRALVVDRGRRVFWGPADRLSAGSALSGKLYLRLNGHTDHAVGLIRTSAGIEAVDRTGDWLAVTCTPDEKARVVESLVEAGIHILDFRAEDASIETAVLSLQSRGDGER